MGTPALSPRCIVGSVGGAKIKHSSCPQEVYTDRRDKAVSLSVPLFPAPSDVTMNHSSDSLASRFFHQLTLGDLSAVESGHLPLFQAIARVRHRQGLSPNQASGPQSTRPVSLLSPVLVPSGLGVLPQPSVVCTSFLCSYLFPDFEGAVPSTQTSLSDLIT